MGHITTIVYQRNIIIQVASTTHLLGVELYGKTLGPKNLRPQVIIAQLQHVAPSDHLAIAPHCRESGARRLHALHIPQLALHVATDSPALAEVAPGDHLKQVAGSDGCRFSRGTPQGFRCSFWFPFKTTKKVYPRKKTHPYMRIYIYIYMVNIYIYIYICSPPPGPTFSLVQ